MVNDNTITKVAFIGSTKLTLKGIEALSKFTNIDIKVVFGINDSDSNKKVNHVFLDNFCSDNEICLFKNDDWDRFYKFCFDENVELIITLGDSRIVPENIINSFKVIGNHGAVLPNVQGGASLVWGRLLNSGEWGISIMEIDKKVDSGKILKIKKIKYDDFCSELEFTSKCDDMTIEALIEVINNDYEVIENKKWDVRVSKHTDSFQTINILKYCLENNLNIYLPPRTEIDGLINKKWESDFINTFKIANNKPYPRWIERED
jgi:methionyl-tRNA formyltransferase